MNMKIAVAYENGEVFQHFGHTEYFKVYEVEEGKVVDSEIVASNCSGHDALAAFVAGQGITVVLCGGIGEGAQNALSGAGIEVVSGTEGNADAAVEAYLKGELTSAGVNCNHHDHEESCDCQDSDESCGGCGGGCGSCGGGCGGCGGCGAPRIVLEGKNAGKTCKVHYTGTFNDGSKFDSSYDRGEPLEFICGAGMMIKGFDAAVVNMEVGEVLDVHLMPEEAYGMPDPDAILTFEIERLAGSEELEVGQQVYLYNAMGQPIPVKVVAKDDTTITLDTNHEMAGKELNFKIELVEVQ